MGIDSAAASLTGVNIRPDVSLGADENWRGIYVSPSSLTLTANASSLIAMEYTSFLTAEADGYNITNLYGATGNVGFSITEDGYNNTVTKAVCFRGTLTLIDTIGSPTVTNAIGLELPDTSVYGITLTNAYGVKIGVYDDATNNWGIYCQTKCYLENASGQAHAVLELEQLDNDEPFIKFDGTSAADQTKSISTVNGDGSVEGPKNYSSSAGWQFEGMIRIDVNGTDYWVPYYSADTS
jgi:hypothetical protein